MRQGTLLCLAAFVASAVAYGGYLTGHEYVYSYEASVFKEYNAKHHQHSGFFFKSKVHVQPHDDFFVIKIDNLVYDKANIRVVGPESYDYNLQEHKEFSEVIEKPFKVYFEHGLVTKIVFSRSDIGYSKNLKKGLISLLQLNLDQVNVIQRHDDKEHGGRLVGPEVTSHYFKAMETGVSGECETIYEIGSDEDAYHTEPVFNITKSRNYENCVKMPYLFYHSNHYDTCNDCSEQDHPIHLSDIYYYNMKGDRMNFVIERVETVGEFYFMPYTFEGERPSAQANRTLQLLSDREVDGEFLSVTGDVVSKDNLLFEFPYVYDYLEVVDLEKAHYLFQLLDHKANIEDIGRLYLELTASYHDLEFAKNMKEKKLPNKFLEIVKMFSSLDLKDIQAFNTQYVHKERAAGEKISKEQAAKYSVFTDILAVTGTNPAILFFKSLIQKKVLPTPVIEHFFHILPQSLKEPHEVLFDEIYKLCQKEIAQYYPRQKTACHLSLSSIVYESCVHSYHEYQKYPSTAKHICTPEDAVKYFNYIIPDYNDPSLTSQERITAIKSAGNFGLKKGIYYLKKYIHHFDYPTYYRMSAIFALRRTLHEYPALVREILVPVYFNHSESNELRIAAFVMIISSGPDLVLLDTIGQGLYREQSRQVTSYVKSVFHHLAHSDYPCYREIKKHIQIVLRHLEHLEYKFSYDFRNSFALYSNGYDERYGLGGASVFSYVTSNDSYVPSQLYYQSSDYVSGKHYDTVSIGYQGFGLDKYFDKIFGPKGIRHTRSLFDIFKRRVSRDTASVDKELKEIDDVLHIKNREHEPIHGDIFIRAYGNEISFWHFDEHTFDIFDKEGGFAIPAEMEEYLRDVKDFTYKRFMIGRDHLFFIPLEIGLPAYLNYKEPALIYYHNKHLKFDVQPSLFSDKRNNEAPTSVSLAVDGYLAHDLYKQATLGIYLPFEKVSIGVGRISRRVVSIPLNFELNYDLQEHKLTLVDHKKEYLPHNILHKCSYPITFINNLKSPSPLVEQEGLLPYYRKAEMKKEEYNWFHDALGVGYHVETHHGDLHIFKSKGDFRKFMAENDWRQKAYYLLFDPYITPYDLDVTVTGDATNPTDEVRYTLKYDHHDSMVKDNKPYRSAALSFEDGSEEHLKAYPGRKVYTNVFKGEVIAKGTKERKVNFEIAYSHTCDHLYQKVNVHYQRNPFASHETEPFEVCLSANLRYPEYDLKRLYNLDTLELDQKIHAALTINYGKECKDGKKIIVKGVLKRSEEQISLEQKRDVVDPQHWNPYAHYYKLCLRTRETLKHHYSVPCRKYIYYATKMHKYLINMEHEGELSEWFAHTIPKIQSFVDHSLYYYMDQERYGINNEANKENIEIVFGVTGDRSDIHIQRPHDDTRFTQVPTPKFLTPLSASPLLSFTNFAKYLTIYRRPFCAVEGDVVRTFDNVTYHLPEIGCYKVIAKDCSEHEYFSVLGKKTTNLKYPKALKAFIGKSKVEILAVTDESELIVRVNGKAVTVTITEPFFYETGEDDHKVELFHIVFNGLYYTVISDHYGLEIYFDGKAIITELSPYYRGKQCGLCGDFNNERHLELVGPEKCVYHNFEDFAYSYTVPQEGCTVPKVKSACEIGAGQRQNCKTYRNRYVFSDGGEKRMCFSTLPLPECAPGCEPTKKVTQNVGFHCIKASESFARFLQRESKTRPLHEVKNKAENYFTEIEHPEDCVHKKA